MGIKDLDVLPREKALMYGITSLSDVELVAIILRTGSKTENVLELSKRVVDTFNGLSFLKTATLSELCNIKGLKKTKAFNLLAIFEIAKRVNTPIDLIITTSFDAYKFMLPKFESFEQECFYALFLNNGNKVISFKLIAKGTNDLSFFDSNDVIRESIKVSSKRIILFHNHPSGMVEPSEFDILSTLKLKDQLKVFHISLVDHLIICEHNYYSMKDNNMLK